MRFWDGRGRLHIRYKVGDLILGRGGAYSGDKDWYGIITKIDPWFMGPKAGIQAETYAIEVLWNDTMEKSRHDISFGNDPWDIVGKAKTNEK